MQTTQPAAVEQLDRQPAPTVRDYFHHESAAPQYVHQPRAPWVPEEAKYQHQRSFTHGDENLAVRLADYTTSVKVFRWADVDYVRLILATNNKYNTTETVVHLTAEELREIAARLLDAAHDLETLPARVLMGRAA